MVFRLLIFIKIDNINWNSAESYGGSAPDQIPNGLGVFVYNQRFPGQVFDAETGLFQNWMREYNPRIGRYMESDPLARRRLHTASPLANDRSLGSACKAEALKNDFATAFMAFTKGLRVRNLTVLPC